MAVGNLVDAYMLISILSVTSKTSRVLTILFPKQIVKSESGLGSYLNVVVVRDALRSAISNRRPEWQGLQRESCYPRVRGMNLSNGPLHNFVRDC